MENNSFCKRENTVTVVLIPGQLTLNCSEGVGHFSNKFRVLHFIHNASVGLNGLSCKVAVRLDKSESPPWRISLEDRSTVDDHGSRTL